jgi:UDP-glucose 4-epimerase
VTDATVNIVGSLNVLEGSRQAGADRIVFAASGETLYGDPSPDDLPVRESHAQQPVTPFGVSKKAVIDYLVAYRELYALEFSALALASVYGPRQVPRGEAAMVALFAEQVSRQEPVTVFGDGEHTRDFVFIDDVVDAFVRAATRGGGLVCNVGTARETSVNELLEVIARVCGVTPERVSVQAAKGRPARWCLDIERAGIQLGGRPWTDLADGVRSVVDAGGPAPA